MLRRFAGWTGTAVACAALVALVGPATIPAGAIVRPPTNRTGAPYWRGWDVVRGVALEHVGSGGYALDAWGGLHPFGNAPALTPSRYTRGMPFAQGLALEGDDLGGVVIDRQADVFPFGTPGGTVTPCDHSARFGVPVRGISLDPTQTAGPPASFVKHGATMDAWGGIHLLCGSPAIDTTGAPYWRGFPIARSLAITEDGPGGVTGGFVLDGWGGVHPFGHAHFATKPVAYWRGWDVARGIAVDGNGNGDVIDAYGGLHPFTYTVS